MINTGKNNLDNAKYYQDLKHFKGVKQVGWKDEKAQNNRFKQFLNLFESKKHFFSLNDVGCGNGGLYQFLIENEYAFNYYGVDLLQDMVSEARSIYDKPIFHQISNLNDLSIKDFSVASGIFNLKNETINEDWLKHVLNIITQMNVKSSKGFAFNMLTKYSDAEKMDGNLFYGDPCFFFNYCKVNFSKNVALLHDYDEYDFTIIVRK